MLNDIFMGSKIPWGAQTHKPLIIQLLIEVIYSLWYVFSPNFNYKTYIDLVCLALSLYVHFDRYTYPLFES